MKISSVNLLFAAALVAVTTNATSATWTFTGSNNVATTSYGTTTTTEADLKISGVSSSSGTGNWAASTLTFYSGGGLGMEGGTSPQHALDNNGSTEAVLLSFDVSGTNSSAAQSVVLTQISTGWAAVDADISVYRYVGSTTVAPVLTGTNPTSMAGWELVGNYGNVMGLANGTVSSTDSRTTYNGGTANITGGLGSSWWLISAYTGTTNTSYTAGDDYFKLLSVAGTKCTATTGNTCGGSNRVPEPGSLALVGLGLVGLITARRRK